MKKILVTGHNGFLGSHLTEELSKKYQIIGLSNEKTKNSKIKQINKDIRKVKTSDFPKDISHIIHLAALTDVQYCQKYPTQCFEVNVMGTQNLLEIARKLNSKFTYISTSHVYGPPKILPIRETHPVQPTSIYSASKIASEIICESYSKLYGINCNILRIFSVYGPKSPTHLVTSRIMSQILTKNVLELGNTDSKRDFIFVADVISAISFIIKKSNGFNLYNVGCGKSHSILELCYELEKIAGKKISIQSKKSLLRKTDINDIFSNPSKLRRMGWKPNTSFKNGLKITFDWFRNTYC